MMKFILFLMTITVSLFSCVPSHQIRNDIDELVSHVINIPDDIPVSIMGRDTILKNCIHSRYKMIIYSDSTECSSCNINSLYLWDNIIKYVDSFDVDINFYFVFSTSNVIEIKRALLTNGFKYPVRIDPTGEFERLNPHLPKNKAMHTFLLDENNNVVLVGNPLHNPKIEKMFKEIVEEKLGKKE